MGFLRFLRFALLRAGQGFWRNRMMSLAATATVILMLVLLSGLVIVLGGLSSGLAYIESKVGVTARLGLDVKTWIWTLAGTYQLKNDNEGSADLLFGARMLDMANTLDWNISGSGGNLPPLSGSKEVGLTNWDGIVGLKGRVYLGQDRKWFLPLYADVGTGESKLTWQVNGGVGYQFDWGAIIGSWRYLDYEFKSSSHVQSFSLNGPLIGVIFKF